MIDTVTKSISNFSLMSTLTKKSGSSVWTGSTAETKTVNVELGINEAYYDITDVTLVVTTSDAVGGTVKIYNQNVGRNVKGAQVRLANDSSLSITFYWKSSYSSPTMKENQTMRFSDMSIIAHYVSKATPAEETGEPNYMPRLMYVEKTGSGYTCRAGAYLHPVKMKVSLKAEPPSTAEITITDVDPAVRVNQLIRIKTPHGDAGLFYVKSVRTDYFNSRQTVLSCEHTFGLMKYYQVIGQKKAEDINAGTTDSSKTTSNAYNAMQYVFGRQHNGINGFAPILRWYLDEQDFAYPTLRNDWVFNSCSDMDALNDVTDCMESYEWRFQFDYDNARGIAHLNLKDTEVTAEVRQSRNLQQLQVTVDMSQMYNLVYPRGKNNRGVTGATTAKRWTKKDGVNYVEHPASAAYIIDRDSVQRWGMVTSIQVESSKTDTASLLNWAANELLKNSEPVITINCTALELSKLTGAPIDKLSIGKICRVPLPQYDAYFEDRIVSAEWDDLMKDPYSIKITLSTDRRTVESVYNKQAKKNRKALNGIGCGLQNLGQ